jgi:hypothetical protein
MENNGKMYTLKTARWGVSTRWEEEDTGEGVGGRWECSVLMYINRKMRPVETTPGVAVRRRKENDGERE